MTDELEGLRVLSALAADNVACETYAWAESAAWAVEEIERLRTIVDKLPKTADGVILTLGVRAFHLNQFGPMHSVQIPEAFVCEQVACCERDIDAETLSGWYSTREAARNNCDVPQ